VAPSIGFEDAQPTIRVAGVDELVERLLAA
jgi:hypothetical protein